MQYFGVREKPTVTRVCTFGTSSGQRNIIPLGNSLNLELLCPRTHFLLTVTMKMVSYPLSQAKGNVEI